jgi:hypothetical protein
MGFVKDRRPIEFHQVCAIARVVLLRDPTIGDAEWKAATRDVIAKQGYDEPAADLLGRALTQVEQAVKTTIGVRPVNAAGPRVERTAPEPRPRVDWKALAFTLESILWRSRPRAAVAPIARETLRISEGDALGEFYEQLAGTDRRVLLRRFAEIAIERDAEWDPDAIRAQSRNHTLTAGACFVCRSKDRPLEWHHILQVQHGGSNTFRNRVALCTVCHADVHPWLSPIVRSTAGFAALAEIALAAAELLRRELQRKVG